MCLNVCSVCPQKQVLLLFPLGMALFVKGTAFPWEYLSGSHTGILVGQAGISGGYRVSDLQNLLRVWSVNPVRELGRG